MTVYINFMHGIMSMVKLEINTRSAWKAGLYDVQLQANSLECKLVLVSGAIHWWWVLFSDWLTSTSGTMEENPNPLHHLQWLCTSAIKRCGLQRPVIPLYPNNHFIGSHSLGTDSCLKGWRHTMAWIKRSVSSARTSTWHGWGVRRRDARYLWVVSVRSHVQP